MNDLIVTEHQQSLVKPAGTGKDLAEAIKSYKEIQQALDDAMPDCIMEIQGKKFRKKNYWRGVKTAFNLKVEEIKEERIFMGDDDWGYQVTYRATASNGASADGDGACTHSEKSRGNMAASLHNIRSQAHTRAFNRAVSNLVGFGEVSAEEVNHSDARGAKKGKTTAKNMEPEQAKLWALMAQRFKDPKVIKAELVKRSGFTVAKGDDKGKVIPGKESIFDLSEKHARVVRKALETEASPIPETDLTTSDKCMTCKEMDACEREPAPDCGFYEPLAVEVEVVSEPV